MSLVAVAVGGIGTAAWYSTSNATITNGTPSSGTFATSNENYAVGALTLTASSVITENTPTLVLTDNYGMTYYKSGNDNVLDATKVGNFAAGTQYVTMTLKITATTTSGNPISSALNTVAGKKVKFNFSASGTGSANLKYHSVAAEEAQPSQAASANESTANYTEKTKTSSGSHIWVDQRNATWAAGTAPAASEDFTFDANYAYDGSTSKVVYQKVFYVGLSGTDDVDESSFKNQTITLGVTLSTPGTSGYITFDA